ncbi:MAG: hypothetical protein RL642_996, partial [Bacteroidota bacterium]
SEQLLIGYFLCHEFDNGFLATLYPDWEDKIQLSIKEKLILIQTSFPIFNPNDLFPGIDNLTTGIAKEEILQHHFFQPDFFIRVRPGKQQSIEKKLHQHKIPFKSVNASAIKITAGIDLNSILELDKEVVVQDVSSQSTSSYFPEFNKDQIQVWDACAGSGGKSIMVADHYKKVGLHVSDIRQEILDELTRRFNSASIQPISLFCTDLQQGMSKQVVNAHLPTGGVDLIIADVPCTGSGTWSRSPEWLKGFDTDVIDSYQERQKNIVSNLPLHLNAGGYLLYITCSVFRQENEDVVNYIASFPELTLEKQGVVHENGGDYLFAALFKKHL